LCQAEGHLLPFAWQTARFQHESLLQAQAQVLQAQAQVLQAEAQVLQAEALLQAQAEVRLQVQVSQAPLQATQN